MRRTYRHLAALLLAGLLIGGCSLNPTSLRRTAVALPGGTAGIGFDDLAYDSALGKVIVPAGATGNLDLLDPGTLSVRAIPGFSTATPDPAGGHGDGTTSAIARQGLLFAIDRTNLRLDVVDPAAGSIVKSTTLITTPDYIRYVPPTNELWVTEKGASQIEVFALSNERVPQPAHSDVITFTNGPEALVIDPSRGLAYTNFAKKGQTVPIDLKTHAAQDPWANGCTATRGMALDEARGILFVACKEGKIVPLDVKNGGKQFTTMNFGANLDFLGYNARLSHLYIPSGASALMGVVGVTVVAGDLPTATAQVTMTLLGTADTSLGSKCIVADDRDEVWVCDPANGQLFQVKDTFPASN
jgi:DNA-binding beta-propeller fold protein YncE